MVVGGVVFGASGAVALLVLVAIRFVLELPLQLALVIAVPAIGLGLGGAAGIALVLGVTFIETVLGMGGLLLLGRLTHYALLGP